MNRAERRKTGVDKEDVERIQFEERVRTINTFSVAVASVLWDLGHDKDDVQRTISKIWDRFDSFGRNYASAEDYRMVLREEAKMDFEYAGRLGKL